MIMMLIRDRTYMLPVINECQKLLAKVCFCNTDTDYVNVAHSVWSFSCECNVMFVDRNLYISSVYAAVSLV